MAQAGLCPGGSDFAPQEVDRHCPQENHSQQAVHDAQPSGRRLSHRSNVRNVPSGCVRDSGHYPEQARRPKLRVAAIRIRLAADQPRDPAARRSRVLRNRNEQHHRPPMSDTPKRGQILIGLLAYSALIAYGSLYPFSGWTTHENTFAFLATWNIGALSLPDLVVNSLIYLPLGAGIRLATARWPLVVSVLFATLIGGALSLSVETLQSHLPQRVSSLSDFILNTSGALAGAVLVGLLNPRGQFYATANAWRVRGFQPGHEANLVLAALFGWSLSQLSPFVPSLDVGSIRSGLAPLASVLTDPSRFSSSRALTTTLEILALALLVRDVRKHPVPVGRTLRRTIFGVLALKVIIVSRQLSAEALAGAAIGLLIALASPRALKPHRPAISLLAILMSLIISELAPENGALRTLNYVPFAAHMENAMLGLSVIADTVWPYLLIVAALCRLRPASHAWSVTVVALCAIFAFALEWMQQYVPGRTPDVTTAVIALITAVGAVRYLCGGAKPSYETRPGRLEAKRASNLAAHLAVIVFALGLTTAWSLGRSPDETVIASQSKPMLPAAETLREPDLPGFRTGHPRLPHPDARDIARLQAENPDYIREVLKRAGGGRGNLNDAILAEALSPGSQDVRAIVEQVLRLQPAWRGHEQTKPIALAYDWLHHRIPPDLMPRLRDKVIEACNYQINVIRVERMSPYNVFLYNSPLQALMACALSIYRDDPRAAPVMAFTHDYWINRVLPVWRQVGGKNGGWHEGGEYVGIGIGQAIYQLPAMWRSATGEDYIAREPAIRGFLDFIVYRQRPDKAAFSWGDIAFVDRKPPDAVALAIELRHPAAYSIWAGRSAPPQPTSWPWGPLTDNLLFNPAADRTLPLSHHFDGLGVLVARSSWEPDATYVSFKAGDNYWSHSHLDQGAFMIYKAADLALDSGCYCEYGSDHHLNYTYQTIAHNTLTVTDPSDTAPMPARKDKPPRPIANDGGQRRIGSGWGGDAAPLDRGEWESKREAYHTGRISHLFEQDGLTVAVADITPAYTNPSSGKGRFAERTRRVERAWRVFAYDRHSDTVVVFDDVVATRADFVKRWLLHSQTRPVVSGQNFTIERATPAGPSRLIGTVLHPAAPMLLPIGGPGFEFFVDDRNHDNSGKVLLDIARRKPGTLEAGNWRIELSPSQASTGDQFLVVLQPTLGDQVPAMVTSVKDGIGAEIRTSERTLRFTFEPGRIGTTIEISADGKTTRQEVFGSSTPVESTGWIAEVLRRVRSFH
ncbi:VanZ family protein [Methyloversatilis sp.]|nr:VanZ family protein [Methyloversatilis sp.]MDP3577203.1 VanZ family protein [Methyloversatilis sp.]